MTTILKGNIVSAPVCGRLDVTEHGYLIAENGVITGDSPVHGLCPFGGWNCFSKSSSRSGTPERRWQKAPLSQLSIRQTR